MFAISFHVMLFCIFAVFFGVQFSSAHVHILHVSGSVVGLGGERIWASEFFPAGVSHIEEKPNGFRS